MGLCVGASLMTIAELFDFCLLRRCFKNKNNKVEDNEEDDPEFDKPYDEAEQEEL